MTRARSTGSLSLRMVALFAGVMLVLAACGDDGDSSGDGGGEPLSEADFIAAYTQICTQVDKDIAALDPDSLNEAKAASAEAEAIVDEGVSELRALEAPEDIAEEVERGTDSLAQTGAVFAEMADAADEAGFDEAGGQLEGIRRASEDILEPLGIECGADG